MIADRSFIGDRTGGQVEVGIHRAKRIDVIFWFARESYESALPSSLKMICDLMCELKTVDRRQVM